MTKPNANTPQQKGKRRQMLHESQDNHGEPQKETSYRTPEGNK